MTLRELLVEKRISERWLAERLGLSRPTLLKYLKKPNEFRVKHVKKIAKYLQLTEGSVLINYFKHKNYE
jgi:transcriptional regulator with XRE-family HTH domain